MKTLLYTLSFVLVSTWGVAQIDLNSTRSNSFGDLQLRRHNGGDTTWKRALVVDYNDLNNNSLLQINYNSDFNLGTRINGPTVSINGNLGIGTTNPAEKLTIKGTDNYFAAGQTPYPWEHTHTIGVKMGTDATAGVIDFMRWTGTETSYGTALISQYNSDGGYGLDFRIDNRTTKTRATTSRMFISSSGEVGIGTTNPLEKLDIRGNIRTSSGINIPVVAGEEMDALQGGVFYNLKEDFPYIGSDEIKRYLTHYGLGFHKPLGASIKGGLGTYLAGYFGVNIFTAGQSRIHVGQNGNVGIGTTTPDQKLTVQGNVNIGGTSNATLRVRHIEGKHHENTEYDNLFLNYSSGKDVYVGNFWDDTKRKSNLFVTGNIGVGIINPAEKLSVNGNIRAQEIKVEIENWPDYVFKNDYKLLSLSDVKKHIAIKGHLPNMPSAAVVKEQGAALGALNVKLLEKIEELTLYTLEQEAQLQQQQYINKTLMERLSQIESKLNQHEKPTP